MQPGSAIQWHWLAGVGLMLHAWEGEPFVLVFQPLSGDTHLLDHLSAEVLRLLGPGAQTAEHLWERLLAQTGLTAEEFSLDRLHALLVQLEQLDLIERVSA
ncbi:MAG: HPr-rel-A system PqqD family peptide chaperone [Thermoguttaceae bacterium]|nr:HPr-rel-A system PqqD family peptide chaperone [Thermoguttaceae bacterium]MDW8036590.1 HPr-rel-A system PqqD family peptide chaperone [Thermoguttaceae bacterium]